MPVYSFEEYADMRFVYGVAWRNSIEEISIYLKQLPNSRIPGLKTFEAVRRHLRESGQYH